MIVYLHGFNSGAASGKATWLKQNLPNITVLNEATGEEYVLTAEQVRALARYQVPRCNPKVPTLVLLDEGDDVLDYRAAQAFYRDCGQVIVYPGGSHRFDHMAEALPEIRALHGKL